jgi:hypothetical protein
MVRPQGRGRWARHALHVSFGAPIEVRERGEAMARIRAFMRSCGAEFAEEASALPPAAARAAPTEPAAAPV